jgi:hypothetical protein
VESPVINTIEIHGFGRRAFTEPGTLIPGDGIGGSENPVITTNPVAGKWVVAVSGNNLASTILGQ